MTRDAVEVADRLDQLAMRLEHLDEMLQAEDPCKWGGADALFSAHTMRLAATLLRDLDTSDDL